MPLPTCTLLGFPTIDCIVYCNCSRIIQYLLVNFTQATLLRSKHLEFWTLCLHAPLISYTWSFQFVPWNVALAGLKAILDCIPRNKMIPGSLSSTKARFVFGKMTDPSCMLSACVHRNTCVCLHESWLNRDMMTLICPSMVFIIFYRTKNNARNSPWGVTTC